jgi:methionyl-tRNA formyltransferase
MKLCIAGKNNIAVDCLYFAFNLFDRRDICVVLNQTDVGKNNWQKSLSFHARKENISILNIDDVQKIENIIFLSLEFDKIIRPELFNTHKLFNIHFSLLPEYKGMFTSLLPILHGKKYSGVTLHRIDAGIDTGKILDQRSFIIDGFSCRELYNKYVEEGTRLVCDYIHKINYSNYKVNPQNKQNSTYYSKSAFNFNNIQINPFQTAFQISQFVKALNFRIYQLPIFNNSEIVNTKIKSISTKKKPGFVLFDDIEKIVISTIDYDIELYKDYYNELIDTCKLNNFNTANKIIGFVGNINETNKNGWTPLLVACYYGSFNLVKLLIEKGANPHLTNLNGTTTLMYAKEAFLRDRDFSTLEILIQNKVNIEAKDIYEKSIYDYIEDIELINFLNIYNDKIS